MSTLYKIEQDYLDIISQVEESEGELTPEMEESLKINQSELQQKSIAYLEVIKTKDAFNGMIDDEIKRLTALKKRNTTLVSNLKDRLLNAVVLFGHFTIGTVTFGIRKSKAVFIEKETALDGAYFKKKVVYTADKALIKKDLEAGVEVKGARLVENKNLSIK